MRRRASRAKAETLIAASDHHPGAPPLLFGPLELLEPEEDELELLDDEDPELEEDELLA